jgi:adenylosuccinate lyase
VISALAGLGASLYKFAFDLRLLQSPTIGELSEPFSEMQVGSSAMPFKRNPVRAEKINSLARFLASLQHVAWDNAAHSLLERTLDDSANRRTILPEAFLASDELLRTANSILSNLQLDETAMNHNLSTYGPFAATERVLMALVKAGADRQDMHEHIRSHSMRAWESLRHGSANPLADDLSKDAEILEYLPEQEIRTLMASFSYIGDAPQRARRMAKAIEESIK